MSGPESVGLSPEQLAHADRTNAAVMARAQQSFDGGEVFMTVAVEDVLLVTALATYAIEMVMRADR